MENTIQSPVIIDTNADFDNGFSEMPKDELYLDPHHDKRQDTRQQGARQNLSPTPVWQHQSVMPYQQQQILRQDQQKQRFRHHYPPPEIPQLSISPSPQPNPPQQQEIKLQHLLVQQQQQQQQQQQRAVSSFLPDQEQNPLQPDSDGSLSRRKFSLGESTGDRLSSIDEMSSSYDGEFDVDNRNDDTEDGSSVKERDESDRETTPTLPAPPDRELFKEFSYPGSESYVGFGNLTAQIQRFWRQKGFDFTLMVVGESGLGKSTLLENLFSVPMPGPSESDSESSSSDTRTNTTTISSRAGLITEGGLSLRLSLVDTPGFGAGLNCVGDAEPIVNYLTSQLERYFIAESGLNRRDLHDCLVHCCFFFINPSTRGLKPLEIQCLKRLHHLVNLIPIVGKADTLTKQELVICKEKVLQDLQSHGIRMYSIPECYPGEDTTFCKQMEQIRESMPYAVIGGNSFLESPDGHRIRVRSYPWGTVDIENCEFSDFVKLRALVITQLQDMREKTHDIIYETYRAERLKSGHQSQRRVDESMKSIDEREKYLSRREDELRRREREVRRVEEVMEVMYGENILKVDNIEKTKKQFRQPQYERK